MTPTLTLPALLLTATLSAQVTVDFGQLDPDGVQLTMYLITASGSATEPSDGANQTWDLSTVTLQPIGTLDFVAAASTPFGSLFPANWAWAQGITGVGTQYTYLSINTSGIGVVATNVPLATNTYLDAKKVMQFPFTLGQSFTDAYEDNDGPASVTWSYTGHGTAITPVGTYTNVVKLVSSEDDLVLWNTNPLYAMVIDDGDDVLAFAPAGTGVGETGNITAMVYPNPCTDQLFADVRGAAPWRITDMQGRTVLTGRFGGMGTHAVDLGTLVTGSYLLMMEEGATQRTVRFNKL